MESCTYDHIEAVPVCKGGYEGGDEGVPSNCSKSITLIPNMLYLLQTDNCSRRIRTCLYEENGWQYIVKMVVWKSDLLSTFLRILSAKTLLLHSEVWPRNRASHTRAKVPAKPSKQNGQNLAVVGRFRTHLSRVF